jgi:hypothetical protein
MKMKKISTVAEKLISLSLLFLWFPNFSKGQIFTGCNYDTLYRHSADCNMYMQCSNGYEYIMKCPLNLVFNEILQACDYVENFPECNGETTTSTATTTISGKEK